jgi:hypothetical protein
VSLKPRKEEDQEVDTSITGMGKQVRDVRVVADGCVDACLGVWLHADWQRLCAS